MTLPFAVLTLTQVGPEQMQAFIFLHTKRGIFGITVSGLIRQDFIGMEEEESILAILIGETIGEDIGIRTGTKVGMGDGMGDTMTVGMADGMGMKVGMVVDGMGMVDDIIVKTQKLSILNNFKLENTRNKR